MTFPLKKLRFLVIRMKKTNLRVCPSCWEKDHPQHKLGTFKVFDPQALQNPRPARNDDRVLTNTNFTPGLGPAGTILYIASPTTVGGSPLNTNLIG